MPDKKKIDVFKIIKILEEAVKKGFGDIPISQLPEKMKDPELEEYIPKIAESLKDISVKELLTRLKSLMDEMEKEMKNLKDIIRWTNIPA
ncbi:MAG: hypothetical protein ACTSVW_07365 [Candidatus Njordarchaeales archaeon]